MRRNTSHWRRMRRFLPRAQSARRAVQLLDWWHLRASTEPAFLIYWGIKNKKDWTVLVFFLYTIEIQMPLVKRTACCDYFTENCYLLENLSSEFIYKNIDHIASLSQIRFTYPLQLTSLWFSKLQIMKQATDLIVFWTPQSAKYSIITS